jgi:CPA1 family monovalent cation:H+ antiporter
MPWTPDVSLDPHLVLVLFIAPAILDAAFEFPMRAIRRYWMPLFALAVVAVLLTTAAVAWAGIVFAGMPIAAAIVLGAIVSPPDAVAATTILSRLSIPRRLVTILEGESLVNDASGLVLYKFAVAAVLTGAFSLVDATVQFAAVSVGGVAVGMALAFVYIEVHKRLGDPFIEVLTVLTIPYAAYLAAEAMHTSGVLAVVAAGLVRGRYAPMIVSAEMRIMARSVWNLLVFLMNSLVFILIGLQIQGVVHNLGGFPPALLSAIAMGVTMVAVAVRFAWVFAVGKLRGGFSESASELTIMGWCGMRGIVSLAAALALPLALPNGDPFPYRDLIIFVTFVVIVATLVGQGLTLAPVIRRLKVGTRWRLKDERVRVRAAMGATALDVIAKKVAADGVPPQWAESLKTDVTERIAVASAGEEDLTPKLEWLTRLRHDVIHAERMELIRLWRENQISDEVMHHLMETLDYEQAHLSAPIK